MRATIGFAVVSRGGPGGRVRDRTRAAAGRDGHRRAESGGALRPGDDVCESCPGEGGHRALATLAWVDPDTIHADPEGPARSGFTMKVPAAFNLDAVLAGDRPPRATPGRRCPPGRPIRKLPHPGSLASCPVSSRRRRSPTGFTSNALSVGLREPEVFRELRTETGRLDRWGDADRPGAGATARAARSTHVGAKKGLEVGTFTGYSALWVASALPPDGRLICCEVSEEYTPRSARTYWAKAGLAGKIDLRLAPALDTLDARLDSARSARRNRFDYAFVDADKANYGAYYELCLQTPPPGRPGRGRQHPLGRARSPTRRSPTPTRRPSAHLNAKLHADDRIEHRASSRSPTGSRWAVEAMTIRGGPDRRPASPAPTGGDAGPT